jgi:hypothetical protein
MCPAHNEITGIPQMNGAQLIFPIAAFLMRQQLGIKQDITAHKYCKASSVRRGFGLVRHLYYLTII